MLAEKETTRLSLRQDWHALSGADPYTHVLRAGPAKEDAVDAHQGHLERDPGSPPDFQEGECLNGRLLDARNPSHDDRVGEGHALRDGRLGGRNEGPGGRRRTEKNEGQKEGPEGSHGHQRFLPENRPRHAQGNQLVSAHYSSPGASLPLAPMK